MRIKLSRIQAIRLVQSFARYQYSLNMVNNDNLNIKQFKEEHREYGNVFHDFSVLTGQAMQKIYKDELEFCIWRQDQLNNVKEIEERLNEQTINH
jgi:hypothetical protein